MKQSTTSLTSTSKNFLLKIFFFCQVMIISLALPSLFYVGITYNTENKAKKHLLITNKGKKTFVSAEEAGGTNKYSPAFMNL